jgi:hypothetical protein
MPLKHLGLGHWTPTRASAVFLLPIFLTSDKMWCHPATWDGFQPSTHYAFLSDLLHKLMATERFCCVQGASLKYKLIYLPERSCPATVWSYTVFYIQIPFSKGCSSHVFLQCGLSQDSFLLVWNFWDALTMLKGIFVFTLFQNPEAVHTDNCFRSIFHIWFLCSNELIFNV